MTQDAPLSELTVHLLKALGEILPDSGAPTKCLVHAQSRAWVTGRLRGTLIRLAFSFGAGSAAISELRKALCREKAARLDLGEYVLVHIDMQAAGGFATVDAVLLELAELERAVSEARFCLDAAAAPPPRPRLFLVD